MKKNIEAAGIILVALVVTAAFVNFKTSSQSSPPQQTYSAADISQGVLHYQACEDGTDCSTGETILCYIDRQYDAFLEQKKQEDGATLVMQARLNSGDQLEVFQTRSGGKFFAMIIGPDKAGMREACLVASGDNIKLINPP